MTDYELLEIDRIAKIQSINKQYDLENNAYLSFSGGKDSTVLHYLLDLALPGNKIPRLFINTGIEYEYIVDFVKKLEQKDSRIQIVNSNVNIKKMLEIEGYPFKSKEHSLKIGEYQKSSRTKSVVRYKEMSGKSRYGCPKCLLYQFDHNFSLKLSDKCCYRLKKDISHKWEKENKKHILMTGMLAEEGGQRANLINCIITKKDKVVKFHPLLVCSTDFENYFIEKYDIELCKLYYPPFNFKRTGCKGCPYSLDLQEELDIMGKYLPEEKRQCEKIWKPVYDEYRRIGYRLKNQTTIFDFLPKTKIDSLIRYIELFGGIGACTSALKKLGVNTQLVDYVEIDKYAVKSFNAMNQTNFEPQDITKWAKNLKNIDLIMHGSPCQDFSLAGKQAGGDKDSGTRSSLLYETLRIVKNIKPKYVIWENVKNILSKKHRHNFDNYWQEMEELGYKNYYQVLNAKDYGIPQNRERVFCVSIRGDHSPFKFPPKQELKLKLKDLLEDEVDEKYYLSNEQVDRIKSSSYTQDQRRIQEKDFCDTLCARDWKDPKCIQVGNLSGGKWDKINESCRRVYSEEGLSPTIHTCQGGNTEPKILIKNATKQGYVGVVVLGNYNPSGYSSGRVVDSSGIAPTVIENHGTVTAILEGDTNRTICLNSKSGRNGIDGLQPSRKDRIYSSDGIACTIATNDFYNPNYLVSLILAYKIRKLTPKECWRLMGFTDEDFEKAAKVNSKTQLYKQAGNSIVVNVLMAIFNNLLKGK